MATYTDEYERWRRMQDLEAELEEPESANPGTTQLLRDPYGRQMGTSVPNPETLARQFDAAAARPLPEVERGAPDEYDRPIPTIGIARGPGASTQRPAPRPDLAPAEDLSVVEETRTPAVVSPRPAPRKPPGTPAHVGPGSAPLRSPRPGARPPPRAPRLPGSAAAKPDDRMESAVDADSRGRRWNALGNLGATLFSRGRTDPAPYQPHYVSDLVARRQEGRASADQAAQDEAATRQRDLRDPGSDLSERARQGFAGQFLRRNHLASETELSQMSAEEIQSLASGEREAAQRLAQQRAGGESAVRLAQVRGGITGENQQSLEETRQANRLETENERARLRQVYQENEHSWREEYARLQAQLRRPGRGAGGGGGGGSPELLRDRADLLRRAINGDMDAVAQLNATRGGARSLDDARQISAQSGISERHGTNTSLRMANMLLRENVPQSRVAIARARAAVERVDDAFVRGALLTQGMHVIQTQAQRQFVQDLAQMTNTELHDVSGATVTQQEMRRMVSQLGTGRFNSRGDILNAINNLSERVEAVAGTVGGGAPATARDFTPTNPRTGPGPAAPAGPNRAAIEQRVGRPLTDAQWQEFLRRRGGQ